MPEPLFNKVAGLRPATLLKKRLWHRRFPVNFAEFLRTPFLQNISWRLLQNQDNLSNINTFLSNLENVSKELQFKNYSFIHSSHITIASKERI